MLWGAFKYCNTPQRVIKRNSFLSLLNTGGGKAGIRKYSVPAPLLRFRSDSDGNFGDPLPRTLPPLLSSANAEQRRRSERRPSGPEQASPEGLTPARQLERGAGHPDETGQDREGLPASLQRGFFVTLP